MKDNSAVEKLINYLDNGEYISVEDTKEALQKINIYEKQIILKIVKLINKRTKEVNDFINVISNEKISEEERISLGYKKFPFQDGTVNIDKLIIQKVYGTSEYENITDLICDLAYNYIYDLKPQIQYFSNGLKINVDNETEHKKTNKK